MTVAVRAGALRTRVDVQERVEALDAAGQPIVTWTSRGKDWADIRPFTGREFFEAQTTLGETRARITMRYRSDVVIKDRVLDVGKSEAWDIEAITDIGNQRHRMELIVLKKEQ